MDSNAAPIPVTDRTRLGRKPTRGVFDRAVVYGILDDAFVCHVAFVAGGQPYAIPTAYARVGDVIYLHGSSASRMARALGGGLDICVTVTLVDGLVLARSGFNHSVNYRSVVVLGRARPVEDAAEKLAALAAITDHIVPGRWAGLRPPTEQELKATAVLALPVDEASAKIRTGPPLDGDESAWPVWAGVVPLQTTYGPPEPAADLPPGIAPFDTRVFAARGAAGR
ncbi:MAG: pyridoxamine 5'-phosphate oxidase family protein [Vicinamibacterales bacterium]